MEKLVLIDGNSLLNRAFYATPVFTTKSGLPTNGVFGFVKLLLKIISDKKPEYIAVAFDLHAPTFRHKLYDEYKAGRKPMPEDLVVQFPILKEVLNIMKIKICELEGFEADDVLGTLAKRFSVPTYIYTGDRDAYQLVDENTSICFTKKGVSDILELNTENFEREVGLSPAQIIDLKALMGDKSDHIPGVAGVGEKSAYSLLEKYKTLDGIYEHLDEINGALHTKLSAGKEDAYFSQKLATILTDAPLSLNLEDCILQMPFSYALKEKFSELEFKSVLTLKIYDEQVSSKKNSSANNEKIRGNVTEIHPESINEIIRVIDENKKSCIACDYSEKELRFVFFDEDWTFTDDVEEYVLPIKFGLLEPGFYDYQLTPVLKRIFEDKKRIIAYNVKEVMHALKEQSISFLAPFDDVSILKCIYDGLGNNDELTFCINQQALPERNRAYGLLYLKTLYLQSLSEEENRLYFDMELPLIPVLFDMEIEGIRVNDGALMDLSVRYKTELDELTEKIYVLAGEKFNINSTKQLGKILFEKLKIGNGVKKHKDSEHYKTTAEELEKYAPNSEIVRQLLRYRKVQKIYSTYIEGFKPLIVNGKVHTTYNQSNTATGRLSSTNPNLQNIPIRTEEGRELRKLFTAKEGNVLVDADYSQIELRLLAHFSGCKELIEAYCEGKDIHAITASQVFGVPLEKVTSDQRRAAKAVNFGIIYGISAFGLGNDLNILAKDARIYIDKYFETYSEVKKYMSKNVEKANRDGYVKTLSGRRRMINELRSSNHNIRSFGERAAMNMPLQGSSADIIKIAMINVHKRLRDGNYKAKLVLQVHDELVIDCPVEEAKEVSVMLKTEMENAVNLTVPLTVEVSMGKTWFDAK